MPYCLGYDKMMQGMWIWKHLEYKYNAFLGGLFHYISYLTYADARPEVMAQLSV